MKKLFFFLLISLSSLWTVVDAKWIVGERKSADQLKVGDTVVIEPASQDRWAGWYLQAADDAHKGYGVMVSEGLGIGDAAIITLEQGPNDIRTDSPTVLLKLVGTDEYVDNHYWDWPGGGFHATANIEKAAPFQLLTCAEPAPWYDPAKGDDFVNWGNAPWVAKDDAAWDEKSVVLSVSSSETDFGYVCFSSDTQVWAGGGHIILSHWTHSCQFNFYEVKNEKEVRQNLEELINAYTSSAMDYAGGSDPGYYAQEAIDNYESLLEQAMMVRYDASATDEQVVSIGQQLKAAREAMLASSIPMSEGYYYIINDMEETVNQGVAEKAMYFNEDRNQIWWGPFKEGDIRFVFYVKQYEDGENWLVQNLKTNQYFGPTDGFLKPFASTVENTFYTKFVPYEGTGSWYMTTYNGSKLWGMCAYGDPSSSDDANNYVYGYNGVEIRNKPHQKWTWRMRKLYPVVYYVDDKIYKVDMYTEGKEIVPLAEPTKEGYTFSGWSEIPDIMPMNDVIVTGTFTLKKATSILINKQDITFNSYETQTLGATVLPEDLINRVVVWGSSDNDVATVDEVGVVTPVNNGTAYIVATTADGTELSDSCLVIVDLKAIGVTIDKDSLIFNTLEPQAVVATISPADSLVAVTWSSCDENIAIVDAVGKVTPVNNGKTMIIARTIYGTNISDTCFVTVDFKATGVTIDKGSLTFNSFEPQTVVATISPAKAQAGVIWSSSDENIVIVDVAGKVTPVNNGEAIIITTTTDGTELKDSCVVSVQIESQFEWIATQTTVSIKALNEISDIRVTIGEEVYASEDGSVKIEGLAPNSTYRVNISAELEGGTWHEAFDVITADITTEFECKASPTTLNITGSCDAGDATVTNASFSSEEQLDKIAATGLEPGQTYTYTYYVTTEEGGTRSYEATFTTEALKLNTSQVKVVTVGDVVVSAESNITEEDNVKVGFEWRRTDWPNEIASKSGAAFIYNGAIEGYIRSLNTDKFWKIRTYFESGAGIKHYGDWITIDPSDASYFEPTVHTYAQAEVEGNTAYVKGYALNGSDKVTEQGFKYWEVLPSDLQPKYPQAVQVPAYAKSIAASGQLMTANISNLMYEMDYHYVAYVTTADGKTYYGEEQRIRIDDPVGIKDAVEESIAEGDVRTYTIDGRLVYVGAEKDMRLTAGLYIIRFADGTTKKVVIR